MRTERTKIALISSSTSSNSLGRTLSLALTVDCFAEPVIYVFDDGPVWVGAKQFPFELNIVPVKDILALAQDLARDTQTIVFASKAVDPIPNLLSKIRHLSPTHTILVDFDDDDISIMEEYRDQSFKKSIRIHPWHRLNPQRIFRAQKSALRTANGVTYSSDYLKQTFANRIGHSAKLESARIPHTRAPSCNERTRSTPEMSETITVGFFGTIRPHKGLQTLLRISEHPDFKVAVFEGQIPDSQLSNSFIQHKTNAPLHELYQGIDLLVVPSDGAKQSTLNQLPAKIIDALAAGCPIAATPTPPIDEFLAGAYLNVDDWSNPSELRKRLESETLTRLSHQSGQIYNQYFSPRATSSLLVELIQNVAVTNTNGSF